MTKAAAPGGRSFARRGVGLAVVAAALIAVLALAIHDGDGDGDDEGDEGDNVVVTEPRSAHAARRASGSSSGREARLPCAAHPLWPEQDAVRRYRMTVEATATEAGAAGENSEAMMTFALVERRTEGEEAVDEYLVTLSSDILEDPIETRMQRRCSDAAGAEEMWTGTSFAGLTADEHQGWRWPSRLHAGAHFAGDLRRRVLGQEQVVRRDHLVEHIESVSTPAGTFDAWRVQTEDRVAAQTDEEQTQTSEGTQWVVDGIGLVRLEQATPLGRMTLELVDRGSSEGA